MTSGLKDNAEVAVLRERAAMVQAQLRVVRAERDRLAGEVERLRVDDQRLQTRVGELAAQVEELRWAGKRQAAPFSNNTPTPDPRRPGRKRGAAYGRHARRPVPDRVDRQITVRFPATCPTCGGEVAFERVADQYQEDLPPPTKTEICRFEVQIGRCRGCRWRVQPRRPAVVCRKQWGSNATWLGREPGRCSPACWRLLGCSNATPSPSWSGCCARPGRWSPILRSPPQRGP